MENVHELLGYKKIKIIQRDDMLRFSLDSTLLADFVKVTNSTKKIIDLGTGNAPIPLFLTLKTTAKIYGIEIQKDVAELAQKSVDINSFNEQIEIINADIKGIYKLVGANIFDIVTSNPPYFKYLETSNINKNDYLTIARHEVLITLEDIVVESTKLLGDGGFLYMVHRCERLPEIIQTLTKYGFGIKKMRFVHSKTTDDKALLVLIAARKNKKSDVEIFKPLFVYNSELEYTEEVKKIFNRK
ncbi:MAG TPA: tRNA1(Val) (adenine(37)-N6)-methyltransferase [Bacilli bacterium]|nr:tRNA1(Val) (adenine(37)-N6)-methyltransferase [Bacilli bacterium]